MCQQVNTLHACRHTTAGTLISCGCPSVPFHQRAVTTIPQGTLCPNCTSQVLIPTIAPPPLLYFPPPPVLPALPQNTPCPGSHGTPLPGPPGTPASLRWEVIGSRPQTVIRYGNPTSNSNLIPAGRHGYNTLHRYDPGALPPGWGAQTNPFPAAPRGYNALHGYDPGNLPPGCKFISS
jgi:hypothetical protein